MNVKIYYCEKCGKQYEYGMFGINCNCEKSNNHQCIKSFTTNVKIPKPHIEPGTLIRVWDNQEDRIYNWIFPFVKWCKKTKLPICLVEDDDETFINYELIMPDEINPDVKKWQVKK